MTMEKCMNRLGLGIFLAATMAAGSARAIVVDGGGSDLFDGGRPQKRQCDHGHGFSSQLEKARKDAVAAVALHRLYQLDDAIHAEIDAVLHLRLQKRAHMTRMKVEFAHMDAVDRQELDRVSASLARQPEPPAGSIESWPDAVALASAATGTTCGRVVTSYMENTGFGEAKLCREFYKAARGYGAVVGELRERESKLKSLKRRRAEAQERLRQLEEGVIPSSPPSRVSSFAVGRLTDAVSGVKLIISPAAQCAPAQGGKCDFSHIESLPPELS